MVPYLWLKRKMFEDPKDLSTVVGGRRFIMTQGLVRHHLLELLDSFGVIGMMFSQAWFPSVTHDFCKNPI